MSALPAEIPLSGRGPARRCGVVLPFRRPATPGLRVTPRGRRLLVWLATGAFLAGALGPGGIGFTTGTTVNLPSRTSTYGVLESESLWHVAAEVAPAADRRDTVEVIKALNGMESAAVHAGQVLVVPAG